MVVVLRMNKASALFRATEERLPRERDRFPRISGEVGKFNAGIFESSHSLFGRAVAH